MRDQVMQVADQTVPEAVVMTADSPVLPPLSRSVIAMPEHRRTAKRRPASSRALLGLAAVFVAFVVAYAAGLLLYARSQAVHRVVLHSPSIGTNFVRADLVDVSVDPVRQLMVVRVALTPVGSYVSRPSIPRQALVLDARGAIGPQEFRFDAGRPIAERSITLDTSGDPASFPFDAHQAQLQINVHDARTGAPVPVLAVLHLAVVGMRVTARQVPATNGRALAVLFSASRLTASIAFALFMMVVVVLLTLSAIAITLQVLGGYRRISFKLLLWMVGLLFAIPTIRGTLPGGPPLGALCDYLVFFWAVGLTGLSMVAIVVLVLWDVHQIDDDLD